MVYLSMLLLFFLICVCIFLLITVNKIYNSTLKRKLHDVNKNIYKYESKGLFNQKFYDSLKKETIKINSIDNLSLSSVLIMNHKNTNKFIILAHGVSIAYVGSLKYLNLFYKLGFNILIIDQRRHGKSEGKYSTYGYFEKYDLNMWINYLINRFGENITLGLHGESMGAATVLETIPLNHNIKFVIEDCGYSNFYELLKYQAYNDYPRFLYYPLCLSLFFANIFIKFKAKFFIKTINPLDIVSNTDVPIMFIHGENDTLVPTYMCKKLFAAKKYGYKEILLIPSAGHANSYETDIFSYESKVSFFINKVLSEKTLN